MFSAAPPVGDTEQWNPISFHYPSCPAARWCRQPPHLSLPISSQIRTAVSCRCPFCHSFLPQPSPFFLMEQMEQWVDRAAQVDNVNICARPGRARWIALWRCGRQTHDSSHIGVASADQGGASSSPLSPHHGGSEDAKAAPCWRGPPNLDQGSNLSKVDRARSSYWGHSLPEAPLARQDQRQTGEAGWQRWELRDGNISLMFSASLDVFLLFSNKATKS